MRSRSALVCVTVAILLAGCGQPVREDRTIAWSPEGKAVGFQHGREGVFVADREGGGLTKIFQPDESVLATSPPVWSPDGKRLIFTTARAAEGGQVQFPGLNREQDPNGNIHLQRPVVYTCWLRDEGKDAKPVPLFEAACDHPGYVAAGLAVRWHPAGDRVLYIRQTEKPQHGLFEYQFEAKTSRRVSPLTAEALLFDWAPDGKNLVLVLGSSTQRGPIDGIWIGPPGGADWWWVPGSDRLAEAELPSLLERLRATRPAWTADGTRFAFVSYRPGPFAEHPGRWSLNEATFAKHAVRTLAEAPQPFRDLHWSPDGRLGVVRGGTKPTLHLLDAEGRLSEPINRHPVRRFAGWSNRGDHLAYIGPGVIPPGGEDGWTCLLLPNLQARDTIFVATGAAGPDREVFSGMQATFPRWSPEEEKLSIWFTFNPVYRSWLSQYLSLGLRSGDPAATFDLKTGEVSWMAVNSSEKYQVGHYYLLKRDYARAWKWYEEADREAPPVPARPDKATAMELAEAFRTLPDANVFEFICLKQLGRHQDAEAKMRQFHQHFSARIPREIEEPLLPLLLGRSQVRGLGRELDDTSKLTGALLRDLYIAEVFLSVDAVEEGVLFFTDAMSAANTDGARLSKALMLTQFLLIQKKYATYADLAVDTIVPLLLKLHRRLPTDKSLAKWSDEEVLAAVQELTLLAGGAAVLAPLGDPEFLAGLPEKSVRRVFDRATEARPQAPDDATRWAVDLILWAAANRLGLEKERKEIENRQPTDRPLPKEQFGQLFREMRNTIQEQVRAR